MAFSALTYDNPSIRKVRETIRSGKVPHAYIVEAPRSVDKDAFALAFAQALLCPEQPGEGCGVCPICRRVAQGNHLDLTLVKATQKKGSSIFSVKDEDVAHLQERLAAKPLEGNRSVAILGDADTMTARASNRLLKTLEEPAPGTVILLLSENMNRLPATVRSRCVHLRLPSHQEDTGQGSTGETVAQEVVTLLEGMRSRTPYYRIREVAERYGRDREEAQQFLDTLEGCCGRQLEEGEGDDREMLFRVIDAIEEAREEILRGDRATNALKKMILTVGGNL